MAFAKTGRSEGRVNRVNLQSNSHAMAPKYCIVRLVAVRSMNTRIAGYPIHSARAIGGG